MSFPAISFRICLLTGFLASFALEPLRASRFFNLFSPDLFVQFNIQLTAEGEIRYSVYADKKTLIKQGKMGFHLLGQAPLEKGFRWLSIDTSSVDERWEPHWGEERQLRKRCSRMVVQFEQTATGKRLDLECMVFNDGVGFRYHFPSSGHHEAFILADELTSFPVTGDHDAFWIPGDYDTNEYAYALTPLSKVHAAKEVWPHGIGFRSPVSDSTVQTPLTMRTPDGMWLSIHEAALVNYPAMQLDIDRKELGLKAHLVPDGLGNKAYLRLGDHTPWRVLLIARRASELLTNRIILHLNEDPPETDCSWFKPGKYLGIWWEMHLGTHSWAGPRSEGDSLALPHGATTGSMLRLIDFAAANGFSYVLAEGWNRGWEHGDGGWSERKFSFTEAYPDVDLPRISEYAKDKGVGLMMHHETYGAVTDYERQLPAALDLMEKLGYKGVKTGYVGRIVPRGEHHDGQWMVNHYLHLAQFTALRKFFLVSHESVRPTGLHRSYPNWFSCEAARGNEFNAWSAGNPPEHETILPFTRLLGGPMDYTPGIFPVAAGSGDSLALRRVHTTLCKQLALYVTLYSPLQMAGGKLEDYESHPGPFQFIRDVPTDWDSTVVLDAMPGDFVYTARRKRGSGDWYVGMITDELARKYPLRLDFLEPGRKYVARMYADAPDAHWQTRPMAYKITEQTVDARDVLNIRLAPGGGCAISLKAEE